jgi:hypothetical protein
MERITVRVGQTEGDVRGSDHRALQSAVDYVASLGGGVVDVLPGVYTMHDSLHLRSNVTVCGHGAATVLRKGDGVSVPLVLDGDYGEEQITVADATSFRVGMGVTVADRNSGGFHTTVARLLWQDGTTFGVSTPLQADCMVANGAYAASVFPVVSGYYVQNARVEFLTVDGNRGNNPHLNGCRGAGIFLYRGHGTHIVGCHVRDYHGDGISFQQSNDVVVEDCLVESCANLGYHPGSGSQRPTLRRNRSLRNDDMGIFLCWRVKGGTFEENESGDNRRYGISIGHKDTDNVFLRNRIVGNGIAGIHFRNESEPMAGHRNRFSGNLIAGNAKFGVRVDGETHDLLFEDNDFDNDGERKQGIAISVGPKASNVVLSANRLNGQSVESEAGPDALRIED